MAHIIVINNSQQVSDWLSPGGAAVASVDLWFDEELPYANQLRGQSPVAVSATPIGLWVHTPNNSQQHYLVPWSRVTAATLTCTG